MPVELQPLRLGQAVPVPQSSTSAKVPGRQAKATASARAEQRLSSGRQAVKDENLALLSGGQEGWANLGPGQARGAGGSKGGQERAALHVSPHRPS